jgi:hypothetical protein
MALPYDLLYKYLMAHVDNFLLFHQSSKGRRPGADDIDASFRLPLLNNVYYRDILGEFGAFFALANRIDRIHKNPWIGFQSWRVAARKVMVEFI